MHNTVAEKYINEKSELYDRLNSFDSLCMNAHGSHLYLSQQFLKILTRVRIKLLACNVFLKLYFEIKKTSISHSSERLLAKDCNLPRNVRFLKGQAILITDHSAPTTWVFPPDCTFKLTWNILVSITLIYTATIMPYSTVFLETGQLDMWFVIEVLLDSIFFLDILINLNTGFHTADGYFVGDRLQILCAYAKSWLLIDIISSIPFGYIGNSTSNTSSGSSGYHSLLKVIRVPKFYKLFRITRIIKLFRHYKATEFLDKIQDFFSIKQSVMRFCTTALGIAICVHIVSCFWYYLSKLNGNGPETWVFGTGLQDSDNLSLYLSSLYWTISTLTTVGYGDVHPYNNLEKLYSVCWMGFSLYFLSFVIGSLSAMLTNIDTKELTLEIKLEAIDEFAKDTMMEKKLRSRLRQAVKYYTQKTGFSWSDKQSIFNELPRNLRHEIAFAMHRGAARTLEFFKNMDPVVVTAIVPFLVPMYCARNDFVYNRGEYAEEIYFIVKGKINYMNIENIKIINSTLAGGYFGDIEVVMKVERKYAVKAFRDSELLLMNKFLIEVIQEEFPAVWKRIRNNAINNEVKNMVVLVQAEELKLLNGGGISYKQYRDNIENRSSQYKTVIKKQLSGSKKKNEEEGLEFLHNEIKNINLSIFRIKEDIGSILKTKSMEKNKGYWR